MKNRALLHIALFFGLLMAKAWLARLLLLDDPRLLQALFLEGPILLAALLVTDLLFGDVRVRAFTILDTIVSGVIAATLMYVDYYGVIPSYDVLGLVGQTGAVRSSVTALLKPAYLLFFVDIFAVAAVAGVRRFKQRSGGSAPPQEEDHYAHSIAYALLVPLLALFVFGAMQVRALPGSADGHNVSRKAGIVTYLVSGAFPGGAAARRIDAGDPAGVQRMIDLYRGMPLSGLDSGITPGAYAGKNVVVIQVEALQTAAIGAKVGGEEVTPNLNRLISESWYFPNCLSQVRFGTTSDAEFIINTSLYAPPRGPAATQYSSRVLTSLPKVLRAQGYSALTFHANDVEFWNRSQLYPAIGFSRWYDRDFFKDVDKISMGASDEAMFARMLEVLAEESKAGRPFYAHVVTLSGHHPFDAIPKDRLRIVSKGTPYEGTMVGRYLSAAEYSDRAIGQFLVGLKAKGLADDTIVIVVGDHFGLKEVNATGREAAAQQALLGHEYTILDRMSVPLIVHLPDQREPRMVESPVGQIDIMPTVASALGADLGSAPHFGRSVFETGSVLFSAGGFTPLGSYVDGPLMYVPGPTYDEGRAWYFPQRSRAPLEKASEVDFQRMQKLLDLSDDYVTSLPLRKDYDPKAKAILP